jgi:hypothetical protein
MSGNNEVLFRASTDKGQTFGDKINLSNTTDAESTRVEIDSDADSVVVTWWETNETSDVPLMRVSDDNGKTFGETIMLHKMVLLVSSIDESSKYLFFILPYLSLYTAFFASFKLYYFICSTKKNE